jgi:hypothetical protein
VTALEALKLASLGGGQFIDTMLGE